MSKSKYKIVSNTAFSVAENAQYESALCRHYIGDTEKPMPMALYKVTGKLPCGKVTETMVIAEDEKGACSQASCLAKLAYEECREFELTALAQQIPFLIRGYGRTEF